jgi:hypothetical protein
VADESSPKTGSPIPGAEDIQKMSEEFMKILANNQDTLSKLMAAPQETITSMLDPFNVMGSFTEGHTSRKKWTHYFWEFLMLFLAVFCGFLAENLR